MNAFSQIKTPEMASKISAAVHLFQQEFPQAKEDLRPWLHNSETEEFNDPDSIDLSFHFPPGKSHSRWALLMQIRLYDDPVDGTRRAIGIEATSHDYQQQRWRFSTVENWEFLGLQPPPLDECDRFRQVFRQILTLFNTH